MSNFNVIESVDSKGVKYTNEPTIMGMMSSATFGAFGFIGGGDGSWLSCVEQMGKWYEANIHTYQGTLTKPRSGRKSYPCPLLGGKDVQDDCSSFVRACLMLYGINCPVISTATMQEGSAFFKLMQSSGFQHSSGNFTPENSQPGDILCGKAATHTEIYAGNKKSWSWGNVHDGQSGRSGMPCGFCSMRGRGGYIHCWRKT